MKYYVIAGEASGDLQASNLIKELKNADNQAEFKKVISNKAFKNKWGELEGAKNKIIHKDLKEPAAEQPLIMNKQFYYAAQIPKPNILDDDLDTQILAYFKASKSVRVFLTKAIGAWV